MRMVINPVLQTWSNIWFQKSLTWPLEITRMGIGLAMLIHYGVATFFLHFNWGETGWLPLELARQSPEDNTVQSVFFYLTASWQLSLFHAVFLFCIAALMVGWRTSWVKWVVWIGHISFAYRNDYLVYGADGILSSLLFIMCLAPIGSAMSLDRARQVRRAKLSGLTAAVPHVKTVRAFCCIRLMQIQMAILFFFSAVFKIKEADWWSGHAVWKVFASDDYYSPLMLSLFASQYWMVPVATYGAVLLEVAFPFLIWQRATRPWLLIGAVCLHLLFFFFLGLVYFSFIMIMGHMSFSRPEWLKDLGAFWKRKAGGMEMIYDGNCGFCKRSMAGFLAFDGLKQISLRNFRSNSSPIVSDDRMEKALHLVLPDGRALPGFEAYRYAVARIPGMWWMIPFFYVPVFSRLVGTPVYNWIAANRSKL